MSIEITPFLLLFLKTKTELLSVSEITKSGSLSPVTSPIARDLGLLAKGIIVSEVKLILLLVPVFFQIVRL